MIVKDLELRSKHIIWGILLVARAATIVKWLMLKFYKFTSNLVVWALNVGFLYEKYGIIKDETTIYLLGSYVLDF